jgi:hypothetical protein
MVVSRFPSWLFPCGSCRWGSSSRAEAHGHSRRSVVLYEESVLPKASTPRVRLDSGSGCSCELRGPGLSSPGKSDSSPGPLARSALPRGMIGRAERITLGGSFPGQNLSFAGAGIGKVLAFGWNHPPYKISLALQRTLREADLGRPPVLGSTPFRVTASRHSWPRYPAIAGRVLLSILKKLRRTINHRTSSHPTKPPF